MEHSLLPSNSFCRHRAQMESGLRVIKPLELGASCHHSTTQPVLTTLSRCYLSTGQGA